MSTGSRSYLDPRELFRLQPPTGTSDRAAELGQSRVRFGLWAICIVYVFIFTYITKGSFQLDAWAWQVLTYFSCHAVLATITHYLIVRYPGHYPARRVFVMLIDTAAISFSIIANPLAMLPLYAVLVWTVVGHGLRFGRGYLAVAMVISQIGLFLYYVLYPVPLSSLNIMITSSLTALIVPAYAWLLLQRVEMARRQAEEASLSKSRFLAQASHDLRQPLHATSLLIGNLRSKGLPPEHSAIVDRIERSLVGVSGLFRSLLDVSQLDSGKLVPRIEPVALGALLRELVAQNEEVADWASSRIRLVATRHVVMTDRVLLHSMVQNLLSNAIKYSDGGDIVIGARLRGGRIAIEVWDRGPGISSEELPHVFEEFYQVRKLGDRDRHGVGLGLSIVRRMGELLDLDVNLRSELGRGTCAAIAGMVPHRGRVAPRTISFRNRRSDIPSPLSGFRVLLVEDEPDILEASAEMLAGWGCAVDACLAIPDLIEPAYDLLISDFDLGGGVTGSDCIAAYRASLGPDAPALVITGHDTDAIAELAAAESLLVVKKPVNPAELRSLVNAIRLGAKLRSTAAQ
ncbi:hybrid sensor histidine kinase/response regulator [Altererythrobacter sp. Z27]|uniref:hybrid sensor histidine kinase/response regulator n=1 Tax=Altererythrobacter sp. Z27 TaxID=3461147 RepID=UPI004043EA0E